MRHRRERTWTDRLIGGLFATLMIGLPIYLVYFAATIEDRIFPVEPSRRPDTVSAQASWVGEEGFKEGIWIDCLAEDQDLLYLCEMWDQGGQPIGSYPYRYLGDKPAPEIQEIKAKLGQEIKLSRGGRLVAIQN